jgi:hypothetical protein
MIRLLTVEDYLMGRDKDFPLAKDQAYNMGNLLLRVNSLITKLNIETYITSGYRPGMYNSTAGGSSRSAHLTCQAVDLYDKFGKFGQLLDARRDLLDQFELYLESPKYTVKHKQDGSIVYWVHLQTRKTMNRVFIPR